LVSLPCATQAGAESIQSHAMTVPWFKHHRPEIIEQHAASFRKVAENYKSVL
jgi:hypothetical protein